jgi:hypothetical protein
LLILVAALASLLGTAQAIPSPLLLVDSMILEEQTEWTSALEATRVQAPQEVEARLTIEATGLRANWQNYTAQSTPLVGGFADRDGRSQHLGSAYVTSTGVAPGLDILVVPQGEARIIAKAGRAEINLPDTNQIQETPYVDSTRPLLSTTLRDAIEIAAVGTSRLHITGSFAVSIWSMNVSIQGEGGSLDLPTGAHASNVVRDPITGTPVAWTNHVQVVQLFVSNGTLDFSGLEATDAAVYAQAPQFAGSGALVMRGATGRVETKPPTDLAGEDVIARGPYLITASAQGSGLRVQLNSLEGTLEVAGDLVNLGQNGPVRDAATATRGAAPRWAWGASVLGFVLAAILLKAPAQASRFNRIQRRFESKDYAGVLQRIEPFTHSRRFGRRAAFLKAISLLSLHEFKEASLFLQTLGPGEAPEPATKAFLQACAAAGLGHDSQTIKHLSDCFRDDPSYIEEAKTVPALVGYLPYFSLAAVEEAAT